MTLRCPACQQAYPMDARRLPAEGIRLRCDRCSAVFFAFPDGSTRAQSTGTRTPALPPAGPYLIRSPEDGTLWRCPDLDTLRTWHQEGRVLESDEVSTDGERWTRLANAPGVLAPAQVPPTPAPAPPAASPSHRGAHQTAALAFVASPVPERPAEHRHIPPAPADKAGSHAAPPPTSRPHQSTAALVTLDPPSSAASSGRVETTPSPSSAGASALGGTFTFSPDDTETARDIAREPGGTFSFSPDKAEAARAHARRQDHPSRAAAAEVQQATFDLRQPAASTTPHRAAGAPDAFTARPREITRDLAPAVALDLEDDPALDDWPRQTGSPQRIAIFVVLLLVLTATGLILYFGTPLGRSAAPEPDALEPSASEPTAASSAASDDDSTTEERVPEGEEEGATGEAHADDLVDESTEPGSEAAPPAPPEPAAPRQARAAPATPPPSRAPAPTPQPRSPRTAPAAPPVEPAEQESEHATGIDDLLAQGQQALDARDWRTALRAFNEARSESPQRPEPVVGEARALLGMGRVDAAGVALERYLAGGARYAPAWLLLGDIRVRQSRTDEARAHYEHVLVLAPRGSSATQARAALERLP